MKRCVVMAALLLLLGGSSLFAQTTAPAETPAPAHISIGERLATSLRSSGLPDSVTVVLISALPIVELRGSIPVGIVVFKMNPWLVFVLSVVGNMIPIPFILLLLGPMSRFFMRFRLGKAFFDWLFERAKRKTADVEKYETLGLTVFVAIPLPATGGWTGAMVAFLLSIKFHHAMWSILLGVVIAGVIMTVLSLLGWVGAAIAGIALTAMVVGVMSRWLKKEEASASTLGSR
jgi:uncharacterized membrane protein